MEGVENILFHYVNTKKNPSFFLSRDIDFYSQIAVESSTPWEEIKYDIIHLTYLPISVLARQRS